MVLHVLFFLRRSFPARVRTQVHVRSDLDALPFALFFFSGPFPLFSGPFGGIRFALCQDSLQFVTARALEKFTRAFPVDHSNCQITMPVSLQCSALARSGLHVCPPQSVRAKIFPT